MSLESSLKKGMNFVGTVDAVRRTYHIYESSDYFMVFSLSPTKPDAGNFNLVTKMAVEYVFKRFAGQQEVSSNDIYERSKRSRHVASALIGLNILYVLTAQGRAEIRGIGPHSKLSFGIQPLQSKKRAKKRKARKTIDWRADYRECLVENYEQVGEPSSSDIRVRPLPGQDLDTSLNVRCLNKMRFSHKVGTIFKLKAKLTDMEGGTPFLHSPHTWPYTVLTRRQANSFLKKNF